jgi:branched-chain amino acid aminotransferase
LTDAVYTLIEANNLTDARIRLTITNGPMDRKQQKPEPTILITASQFQPYPEEYYKKGIRVALSAFKQNPANPVFYHKTLNYMPRLLALNEARQKGAAESIWFTVDNRLAEASTANVFLVKDSALLTPPVDTPVLAGIARKTVISLAHNLNIKVTEKPLHIHDLLEADEVFLTNVIMQLLAVNSIEKHPVSNGQVGPTTKKLAQAYLKNLQNCCTNRID